MRGGKTNFASAEIKTLDTFTFIFFIRHVSPRRLPLALGSWPSRNFCSFFSSSSANTGFALWSETFLFAALLLGLSCRFSSHKTSSRWCLRFALRRGKVLLDVNNASELIAARMRRARKSREEFPQAGKNKVSDSLPSSQVAFLIVLFSYLFLTKTLCSRICSQSSTIHCLAYPTACSASGKEQPQAREALTRVRLVV